MLANPSASYLTIGNANIARRVDGYMEHFCYKVDHYISSPADLQSVGKKRILQHTYSVIRGVILQHIMVPSNAHANRHLGLQCS